MNPTDTKCFIPNISGPFSTASEKTLSVKSLTGLTKVLRGVDLEVILSDRKQAGDPKAFSVIENRIREQLPDGFVLKSAEERVVERAGITRVTGILQLVGSFQAIS